MEEKSLFNSTLTLPSTLDEATTGIFRTGVICVFYLALGGVAEKLNFFRDFSGLVTGAESFVIVKIILFVIYIGGRNTGIVRERTIVSQ